VTASLSHVQFGSVPDWITAIGTTLAFLIAFVVLSLDLRERRRHQATQVAAWFERSQSEAVLHIINSSDTPIYNVKMTPQLLGRDYDVISYPLVAPKADHIALKMELPGSHEVSNKYLSVQMSFADSGGRRWKRTSGGRLRRKFKP
jgi:cbb3-type cytochrome oxidase subunit 1